MQMESYTAEKRILNQQLGRRRANRVDACLPACFSSLGQRRWQNSCRDMHADMFAVLRPLPFPFNPPCSLRGRSTKQHQADFVFSFDIRKEGPPKTNRSTDGGGDTNICSSGFAEFEILTNPGWILSMIVDRNCFSPK